MKQKLLYLNAWLTAMFFGTILSETVLLYPNIFHNVPDSLSGAMDFLKIIGPGQFFPKLGAFVLLISVTTLILNYTDKKLVIKLGSVLFLIIVVEFLFSVYYFWPRNRTMFIEGINIHSAEVLIKTANEFVLGHYIRLAGSLTTSLIAFTALTESVKNSSKS